MGKEKPGEKKLFGGTGRRGREKPLEGAGGKKMRAKESGGKIAASEENRHLHSALHLLLRRERVTRAGELIQFRVELFESN